MLIEQGSSYKDIRDNLRKRLRRIEGQIRGVERMLDEDRYCIEVLTQLLAVTEGVRKVSLLLTEAHVKGCVRNAILEGQGDEAIEELVDVLMRFSR